MRAVEEVLLIPGVAAYNVYAHICIHFGRNRVSTYLLICCWYAISRFTEWAAVLGAVWDASSSYFSFWLVDLARLSTEGSESDCCWNDGMRSYDAHR